MRRLEKVAIALQSAIAMLIGSCGWTVAMNYHYKARVALATFLQPLLAADADAG